MILKRLYELAERERLLDDPAFETLPVPYIVKLSPDGKYLGIEERRGTITIPSKKGPDKTKPDRGIELPVPKAHGNTANAGFARFFADTLARVLPINDEPKSVASQQTFWKQIDEAADGVDDPALHALQAFGRSIVKNAELTKLIRQELEEKKADPKARCTFAWHEDNGTTILQRDSIRSWWRKYFSTISEERAGAGPEGICQVTAEYGPIATVHATRISGVPGGLPTGVSVISNDKAAFESYRLEGAANAGIGYRAADGYTRALNALISNKLPGHPKTSLRVGETILLFWTRNRADADDIMAQFENPDPAQVERLIKSVHSGQESHVAEPNDFYCLTLSGNSARAVVRNYLERPLENAKRSLARWFDELRIMDAAKGELTCAFPLWMLLGATVREVGDASPSLPFQLLNSALNNAPLPLSVLGACLKRLQVEGSGGFRPSRMALIKLILNRVSNQGEHMMETLDPQNSNPAYRCGQLLAVFERLQWASLGDVNATIVDRFYGVASTSPGLVFPRLFKSAEQHLSKLHGERAGMAVNLQKDIEAISIHISAFPNLLSLSDQGRFALGFYHQRAAYRSASLERKAAATA